MNDLERSGPPARPLPTRPVFARHAASLLVVQHAPSGPSVLMGVRSAGHRFMPNRLVFPGGAVDPADRTAPAASEPAPELLAILGRHARPPLARALPMAAARELHEETGLSLGAPPRLDALRYLCRAITPSRSPIRFNARFMVIPADAVDGALRDGRELHGLRYVPLHEIEALEMMDVTRAVLDRLQTWLRAPDEQSPEVFRQRRWRLDTPRSP